MGFSVIRCFSFLSRKSTMASRLSENVGFAITSSIRVLCVPRPDIIYLNSWVIFGSGLVSAATWIRGIPVSDERPGRLPGIALATEKDWPAVTSFQNFACA
jgi:hypothetical protein